MTCVTVAIREDALTYRVRVTAPSIERALEIAAEGKPSRLGGRRDQSPFDAPGGQAGVRPRRRTALVQAVGLNLTNLGRSKLPRRRGPR